jgi:hypothetical protein
MKYPGFKEVIICPAGMIKFHAGGKEQIKP